MNKAYRAMALVGALAIVATSRLAAEDLLEKRETWTGIRELVVEMASVSIETRVGGDRLQAEPVDVPDRIPIAIERSGSTLRLIQKTPRFGILPLPSYPGKIVISIPQGTTVRLGSSSGNISLDGLDARSIVLSSSSGNIRAEDCSGPIEAKASSGSITLKACEGEREVGSSSGDIRIEGGSGDIVAHSSSGGIAIDGVDGDLDLGATSGSVRLEGTRGALRVNTSSGSLLGEDVLLEGGASFTTSSGDIGVTFRNAASELRFDLRASSGNLSALGLHAEKRLQTGSGSLLVEGASSSGSQTYRSR